MKSKPTHPDNRRMWGAREAAVYLGISTQTLRGLHHRDATFPRPWKLGAGAMRYDSAAIAEWVSSKTQPTNPPGNVAGR
jgi:predicted DNA-binding transcriptional regulator AlpA